MNSRLNLGLFLVVAVINSQSGDAQNGYSTRYQFGQRPFTSHAHSPSVQPSSEMAKPKVTLEQQFLNLFRDTEAASMASSCFPRVTGDLSGIGRMCSRKDFYFGMNPRHIDAVQTVTKLMMSPGDAAGQICVASQLKNAPEVNPNIWIRSLMSSAIHSPELRGLQRPSLVEVLPSMLIQSTIMREVKRIAQLPLNARGGGCIVLDGSFGTRNGIENALWYWREDVMLNSHHWYWHLANPFMVMPTAGQQPPSRPDRRGELFSYMHSSLLARYHSERLSNGLRKIVPLNIEDSTLIEPYYANLDGTNSGQQWTDRPPNSRLQDIFFNQIEDTPMNISIAQRNILLRRILEAVDTGRLVLPNNEVLLLDNLNGIDFLGEVVEASVYSPNPRYYGAFGVHNEGHFLLALIQDADGRQRLPPGVMADASTAMRDPVFYRFHLPIAQIFDRHKHRLHPYHPTEGEFPLLWPGVQISKVQVVPKSRTVNKLTTFWNDATYDLSRGLDFNRSVTQGQNPIYVCLRHLDYENFDYEISLVKDPRVKSNMASIRIFLAPRYDENGRPYTLREQRTLFFALDYFTVSLKPGENFIRRRSSDSSLTISWPQRLEELERDTQKQTPDCGCGFPQHLLLPKGKKEGMTFDLFVMATNADEDAVPYRPPLTPATTHPRPTSCIPAPIYCGVPGQLYPDSKPMGYPFDRLPYSVHDMVHDPSGKAHYSQNPRMVQTIEEYVNGLPNTATTQVVITHSGS